MIFIVLLIKDSENYFFLKIMNFLNQLLKYLIMMQLHQKVDHLNLPPLHLHLNLFFFMIKIETFFYDI